MDWKNRMRRHILGHNKVKEVLGNGFEPSEILGLIKVKQVDGVTVFLKLFDLLQYYDVYAFYFFPCLFQLQFGCFIS